MFLKLMINIDMRFDLRKERKKEAEGTEHHIKEE